MARNRSTPDESTGSDEPYGKPDDDVIRGQFTISSTGGSTGGQSRPEGSTDDASGGSAVHVDDNNPSVDFLEVDENLEPDSKVHCQCGAVEWDSQDASMGAIAADLDGTRHTIDECRDLEELKAERSGKSDAKSDEG